MKYKTLEDQINKIEDEFLTWEYLFKGFNLSHEQEIETLEENFKHI